MKINDISRRNFIKTMAAGVGTLAISSQLSACMNPFRVVFSHGVASGDPLQDRLIIWTRALPQNVVFTTVNLFWQVATDRNFHRVIADGFYTTSSEKDFTVKVDVKGLSPGTRYYYRFIADDVQSPKGKGKTLPTGDVDQVNLAVFSCANYPAGYFHVYGEAAKRNYDAVIHLGDYIYEYGDGGYGTKDAVALDRVPDPQHEILQLADYRKRYAQYRSDEQLQELHRNVPFIMVWDDHEIANDAWRDGAENHSPEEGDFYQRKADAIQAFMEWLPIREQTEQQKIYRSFDFGGLVSLHMLDTRIIGRDRPLNYADFTGPSGLDSQALSAALNDSSRTLLGQEQLDWLQYNMASSTATWQVLGQQVLMGRMNLPAAIVTQQLTISEYAELGTLAMLVQADPATLSAEQLAYLEANVAKLTAENLALLSLPKIPYNLDAWDGYPYERERVLGIARALDKNLVVLAGDTHNAWANNLVDHQGASVGVEFATSSVSSPGLEEYLGLTTAQQAVEASLGITQLVDDLQYCNLYQRGFMSVSFTKDDVKSEWLFVDTVKSETYELDEGSTRQLMAMPGAANRNVIG